MTLSDNKGEGFLFGNVRPHPLPPGRGYFVDRKYGARLTRTSFLSSSPVPETG
ncbi:hypothetical protein [Streptosporangium roseum]|uniref:hypothetical protein n=1 Tax=Streptosporangium roseum TaxID=2001 RepID=UPI0001A38D7F|nr:hypothetical protein [Streptosporangium roseum]